MVLSDRDIVISKDELKKNCELIGHGDEGLVFNYRDKYAIKIFKDLYNGNNNTARSKMRLMKLKEMMLEQDDSFALPLGFVSFDGENYNGIYSRLVKHNDLVDFNSLDLVGSKKEKARYLLMGDEALQRIHSKGFVVGDIKPDNILIDEHDKVVFIDCDNYRYKKFMFDTIPTRAGFYYRIYGDNLAYKDNDKLVYAVMALELLTGDSAFNMHQSHEGFRKAIKRLHLDKEIEDYLNIIFSKQLDKPYVGPAIEKMLIKK